MRGAGRWYRWGATLLATLLLLTGGSSLAAQGPGTDGGYREWLAGYLARQRAALQAVPTQFDLANPAWRRELALAIDAWGQLGQEARDQQPPAAAAALHAQLLQALDTIERVRRQLLVAMATGEPPPESWAAELRAAREALAAVAERAGDRGATGDVVQVTRGNLRITVLEVQRPYVARGAPADPAWEYLVVRLRLENLGGEPIRYDAFQFRLRAADETLHPPTPLQVPDELLWGALDGNRLAGQIVGNIAYAVRRGVPAMALWYERQPGEPPAVLPLGTPQPAPTAVPTANAPDAS